MKYFAFQWHITDECDQRCKHCYIFAEGHPKLEVMTWPQMVEVVSKCEDFCRNFGRLPYFYITGGDPILHPDFWKLMELLKGKDIPFTLMGNPFHLTDEVCLRLKAYGCDKYQMSLDGLEKTHDWFRKPGSFKTTLEKIGCINRAGITSVIMTTVSSVNYEELPSLVDVVVEAGVDVYAFARYVPTSGEKSTGIKPLDYRAFLGRMDAKFKHYEKLRADNPSLYRTYFNRKDHLWTLYQYETGEFSVPAEAKDGMVYGGCNCGNCHLTILPKGEVFTCRRVASSQVGNIFEDDIKDLWTGRIEEFRDFSRFVKCSKCKLLGWCRGCPAVANGTFGSFYAEDPQCWMEV